MTLRTAARPLLAVFLVLAAYACSQYQPFDSAGHLRGKYGEQLGREEAAKVVVPFELDAERLVAIDERIRPALDERRRVDQVIDYIFNRLDLEYSLQPTRTAVETFVTREGNCLSFVNLFVGVARHLRLNPFYVEVIDYQRWNHREGLLVSQGHIVAGLMVKGQMKTFDFLPYRAKGYKDFKPIDDLTAAAHYYNNLGAEALLDGDLQRAKVLLATATRIAPRFERGLNNLGVCLARLRDYDGALEAYGKGLAIDPENVPLLTNLAGTYLRLARSAEANEILAKIDTAQNTNPYFFVYRGELALAAGDTAKAKQYLVEALRRDTEVPEVHIALVKLYMELGDLERARHHLGRALNLDATNPEARKYAVLLEQAEAK
ncbi:MAG TPA: tetratricopeptide repeat protein [Thermoanaerobaculia bacterium]